jgi:hypothetical protein
LQTSLHRCKRRSRKPPEQIFHLLQCRIVHPIGQIDRIAVQRGAMDNGDMDTDISRFEIAWQASDRKQELALQTFIERQDAVLKMSIERQDAVLQMSIEKQNAVLQTSIEKQDGILQTAIRAQDEALQRFDLKHEAALHRSDVKHEAARQRSDLRHEAAFQRVDQSIAEIKTDIRILRKHARTDFRLLFGLNITTTLGLTALFAKGFGWI